MGGNFKRDAVGLLWIELWDGRGKALRGLARSGPIAKVFSRGGKVTGVSLIVGWLVV